MTEATARPTPRLPWILLGIAVLVIVALAGYVVGRGSSSDDASPAPASTTEPPTSTSSTLPATTTTNTAPSTTEAAPPDFADLFEDLRASVGEVEVTGCDFGGTGTAFLIRPQLAVTAWHVMGGVDRRRQRRLVALMLHRVWT